MRHLIYFIKEKQGIVEFCFPQRLDNFPRHGTNISPAMPSDFGFITYSSQTYACKFSSQSFCNRTRQGCLSNTRRSHQTNNWTFHFAYLLSYSKIFYNTFFYFFQTVVLSIQDFFSFFQVEIIFRFFCPGHAEKPVNIISNDICF